MWFEHEICCQAASQNKLFDHPVEAEKEMILVVTRVQTDMDPGFRHT
ncbi:MAG: hypothetical protein R3C03_06625 [Pirellulaceae bacterium]